MKTKTGQRIVYVLQVAIGIILVVWILAQVDQQQFVKYFTDISVLSLLIILLLSAVGLFIQFRRWKYLIESYSVSFNLKDIVPSFFSGFTFRIVIPGGHAELSKIFLLPGKKRGKILAFGMERLFQTVIKVFAILIVIPLSFPDYWIHCLFGSAILVTGYFFLPKIPILKNLQEKDVNYHRLFGMNLIFSAGLFIIMGIQYYILLNEIEKISLFATYHTAVYLWGAEVVPISIAGLGIREGLAVYFFKMYQISAAHAVATTLFLFAINTIIPAIAGAYFIYKNRDYFRDIPKEIKTTREIISLIRNNKRSG